MRRSLAALSPPPAIDAVSREAPGEDATTRPESVVPVVVEQRSPVPGVRALAAEVKSMLPNIDFTVHVYAREPAARVVQINGEMLREGDAITPKLRLVEITRGGVVMEAGGNLFQMGAQEEWLAR